MKKFSDAKVSHSFEAVTRFITAHKYLQNCLGEPDKDDTTLLHAIARTLPHDFDEWKELFKWLMTNYPVLYQVEDGDGGTILSNAIRSSKCSHFVKFFTTEFPKQTSVVLQKDRELFSRLLPMVQEATLGLLDELDHDILMYKYSEGNTLLHLVSQYNYVFQEPSCGLDTHESSSS